MSHHHGLALMASALALLLLGVHPCFAQAPWEVWKGLEELPRLRLDDRVELMSSRCPDGCRYDRHSSGDSRFLYEVGNEGFIFDQEGPGAVTRIWMAQGEAGLSVPLDAAVSIRIRVDGQLVVDVPLPDLFSGSTPPFVPPLVSDRTGSSGGNVSYVPIPYRHSCQMSLVDAADVRIWFQVHHHRLATDEGINSFTGSEDLSSWSGWLDQPGSDPWAPSSGATILQDSVDLFGGSSHRLVDLSGPDSINTITLTAPRASWPELRVVGLFDGHRSIDLPLAELFGIGRATSGGMRSVMVGVTPADELYCYFPMPFFRSAQIWLELPPGVPGPVPVAWEIHHANRVPAADSGYLTAVTSQTTSSTPGHHTPIVQLTGSSKWVGLFAEMGSVDGPSREYLEGDEHLFIDGSFHPMHYGTGVEDFYGGGFYFRTDSSTPRPFTSGLHGMTYDIEDDEGLATGMYRLMLTDAPTAASSLIAAVEGGPWGDTSIRVHAVAWAYVRPEPALQLRDVLLPADPTSAADHAYTVDGTWSIVPVDSANEDEPPTSMAADCVYRQPGSSAFLMAMAKPGAWYRLRRTLDADIPDQRATVQLDASATSHLSFIGGNPHRRWREQDTVAQPLPGAPTGHPVSITVEVPPDTAATFTSSRWELWSGWPTGACDVHLDGLCDAADLTANLSSPVPANDVLLTIMYDEPIPLFPTRRPHE